MILCGHHAQWHVYSIKWQWRDTNIDNCSFAAIRSSKTDEQVILSSHSWWRCVATPDVHWLSSKNCEIANTFKLENKKIVIKDKANRCWRSVKSHDSEVQGHAQWSQGKDKWESTSLILLPEGLVIPFVCFRNAETKSETCFDRASKDHRQSGDLRERVQCGQRDPSCNFVVYSY